MLIEKHLGSQKALHLRCEKGRYAVPRVDRKKLRERDRERSGRRGVPLTNKKLQFKCDKFEMSKTKTKRELNCDSGIGNCA